MYTPLTRGAVGLLGISLLAACSDPISDVKFDNWEPEVAAPVLNTSFTLRDAIGDTDFSGYITEDEDSALRLFVSQKLFDVVPAESIELPDITIPLLENNTTFNFEEEGIDFGFSRVDLNPSDVVFTFRNDFPQDAQVFVTTNNIISEGKGIAHGYTVPANSTTKDTLSLGAFTFATNDSGNLEVDYTATLTDGSEVQLTIGALAIEANEFTYAEGKLDNIQLDLGTDTIALDMLEVFEAGRIALVNPRATIRVNNEIGVPFALQTPSANGVLASGEVVKLNSQLTDGFTFDYPSLAEGKISKNSEVVIDNETSNVTDVINRFPQEIHLGLAGQANPDSLDEKFFIHRDARMEGSFEFDMPLAVRFNGFELEQELIFDGSSLAEAETAAFLLTVDNGFGLSAATQVYFYDAQNQVIDSLFNTPTTILAAAEVDEVGETTAPTKRITEIEFNKQRVAAISGTRKAKVVINLTSPNDGNGITRLYYDNAISVKLGARVSAKPF